MPDTSPIRCLVVDDEPPARQVINRYILQTPLLQLAGECSNAIEAMDFLHRQPVDLLFLDINMPQLKGTELVKVLSSPPKVIFTTAHAGYALEGYELDAIDFLLKPIQFDRFLKAVNKLLRGNSIAVSMPAQPALPIAADPYIYLRTDRKMMKVMLNEITYIESMKDYVKVFTSGGMIITRQSMAAMAAMLPEKDFLRVHRSFLVNTTHISSYTGETLNISKIEIPIGKLFRQQVLKQLGHS